MVLAVAGNVEWHAIVDAVRDLTGDLTNGFAPPPSIAPVAAVEAMTWTLISRGTEERIPGSGFPTVDAFHEDVAALENLER